MSSPVSSIPNLGPASEAAFARAGIHSAEDLREIGADEGYRRLLRAGSAPHFIGYYVLVMGLQGRPWNDCQGAEKKALRKRFDAIKSELRPELQARAKAGALEAFLDQIGVRPAPGKSG
jgi:DNA transformation protein and related proteins